MSNKKNNNLEPDFIKNNEIIKELLCKSSGDRARAILGATIVEEALERLIRIAIVEENQKKHNEVFDANGFLNTFSDKVKALIYSV